ncbi:MAG: metalloregulator ArsR/SmtB family transcription factor [Acidobacteriia bacterium]|nr:metalloregulator ArsR/SmtB family transcription factor [Methyloceanibacter sp.]MCL6490374.1 metalloregulator ArsR/SmtB family transcription factor [Terriglobia bacterium]
MVSASPKLAVFAQFAAVAGALAHPHRLEILEHLAQGERSVEALAERIGLSVANTSQHLHRLRRAGLVASERKGKFMSYRLADEAVIGVLNALRKLAERRLAEIDRIVAGYFAARDSLEPISRKELLRRVQKGLVTVLDVRPADEFAFGHVLGAVNIPLGELKTRLAELDPGREVVAYCRGPYCVLAFEAVAELRRSGFRAYRLEDGFPEWKAEGLPVETDASIKRP